jgi:hypothetical protein
VIREVWGNLEGGKRQAEGGNASGSWLLRNIFQAGCHVLFKKHFVTNEVKRFCGFSSVN